MRLNRAKCWGYTFAVQSVDAVATEFPKGEKSKSKMGEECPLSKGIWYADDLMGTWFLPKLVKGITARAAPPLLSATYVCTTGKICFIGKKKEEEASLG